MTTVQKQRLVILVFGIVVLGAIAYTYGVTRGGIERQVGTAAIVPAAWTPPAGFELSSDPAVAYRWATTSEYDCEIADKCWGMFVVPQNGCPSTLYVELALTDAEDNAVGYTNDTAGAVSAGQQAKLVFDSFEDGAVKARLAKVSCR